MFLPVRSLRQLFPQCGHYGDERTFGRQVLVDGRRTRRRGVQLASGTDHTIGVTSPQTGVSGRRTVSGLERSGSQSHTVTAPDGVDVYGDVGISYALTGLVNPVGAGTLTFSPAALTVAGNQSWYAVNQVVTATATPANAGYTFAGWTGGPVTSGDGAGTGGAVGTLVMDVPKTLVANFSMAFTVTTVPVGLSVMVDGVTYTTPQDV